MIDSLVWEPVGFDASEVAWWRDRLASVVLPGEESALIDLVRELEDLKSCAAAVQAGQGLCEACNHAKQQPGWRAAAVQDPVRGHVVTLTTPTGHRYESTPSTGPGDR